MTPHKLTDKRGNLVKQPANHDDQQRLRLLMERLRNAYLSLPGVRETLDDRIADAVEAQGQGGGSGISDSVARAAAAIEGYQHQHRALTRAVRGVEDSVEHLRVEAERVLSLKVIDPPPPPSRCPAMKLRGQHVPTADGVMYEEVLIRCDRLTAHKVDANGNAIDHDRDGLCEDCRAEANEAMRRAQVEQGRRLRRRGAA